MSKKSRYLGPCILVGTVLLVFLSLEAIIRIMPKLKLIRSYPERPLEYLIPVNSPNLRGNLPQDSRNQKNEYLISVVGDSFTFAPTMQSFDAFPKRLELMLNLGEQSPRAEVVSYGTPGASTWNEVELVKRALSTGTDLIVLQITLNDAQERPLREEPAEFSGKGSATYIGRALDKVFSWSALYRFICNRISNGLSVTRYIKYHYSLFEDERTWGRFTSSLEQMKILAADKKVQMVVVLFPLFDFPLDDKYPFIELHKKIIGELRRLEIPSLDLFSRFKGIDPYRLQLIPGRDSHPNEIAHRIAAEELYSWLAQQKILPEDLLDNVKHMRARLNPVQQSLIKKKNKKTDKKNK